MPTPDLYREQLAGLLPPGRVWTAHPDSTLHRLLGAFGELLARVHAAAEALLVELYAPSTIDLLPAWERLLGLPDECTPIEGLTLQERRALVVERLTQRPAPTLPYLQGLAYALGYSATVTESGPFQVTIVVPAGRVTYFRTGESRCGDLLGKFDQADDLECLLRERKPAHITLIFSYTGA